MTPFLCLVAGPSHGGLEVRPRRPAGCHLWLAHPWGQGRESDGSMIPFREGRAMPTLDLDDVQHHLPELIAGLNPGDPLVITKDGEPIATLTRNPFRQWPCKAGSARDTSHWMAPDFDAPLEEFRESME